MSDSGGASHGEAGGEFRLWALILIKVAVLLGILWSQVPQVDFLYAAF